MKMIRTILPASALLTLLLVMSGCGGVKPSQKILGKWQEVGGKGDTMEFFEDGTWRVQQVKPAGLLIGGDNGKWIILQDGRLKMDVVIGGTALTEVFTLQFDGDDMVITDEKGKATRNKRVK